MANIKDLVEKRNAYIKQAKDIKAGAKKEKRSLAEKDFNGIAKAYRSAKTMNAKIKAEKAERDAHKDTKLTERSGKPMKKQTLKTETRAMNRYLRGNSVENRDLNLTLSESEDGGVVVPKNIYGQIVNKLTEDAPLMQSVRHIASSGGSLTIPRETDTGNAGFIGEAQPVSLTHDKLDSITLHQKRVGARAELTNSLIQDASTNLVNYATNRLSRDFSKTLEKAILTGVDGGFAPVVGSKGVKSLTFNGGLTTENIIDLFTSINPSYLKGAMLVVSRDVFDQIVKLKDGDGRYIFFYNNSNNFSGYTFKGVPVVVSDTLNGQATQIVLGNFDGYGVMQRGGINLQHVDNDTNAVLNGKHLVVMSAYMDGGVINPDAFVTASVKK